MSRFVVPTGTYTDDVFQYKPYKYPRYDLYKGNNIMLRDDEDLGYLTFGNFFKIDSVDYRNGASAVPNNTILIGSVWIPIPKYLGGTECIRLNDLPDYYSNAVKNLVDVYLNRDLSITVALGIVEIQMPENIIKIYMESKIATLKTFVNITSVTDEEREILKSACDHPWSWQERYSGQSLPELYKMVSSNYKPLGVYPEGDYSGD